MKPFKTRKPIFFLANLIFISTFSFNLIFFSSSNAQNQQPCQLSPAECDLMAFETPGNPDGTLEGQRRNLRKIQTPGPNDTGVAQPTDHFGQSMRAQNKIYPEEISMIQLRRDFYEITEIIYPKELNTNGGRCDYPVSHIVMFRDAYVDCVLNMHFNHRLKETHNVVVDFENVSADTAINGCAREYNSELHPLNLTNVIALIDEYTANGLDGRPANSCTLAEITMQQVSGLGFFNHLNNHILYPALIEMERKFRERRPGDPIPNENLMRAFY